jgi:hypothetical protein
VIDLVEGSVGRHAIAHAASEAGGGCRPSSDPDSASPGAHASAAATWTASAGLPRVTEVPPHNQGSALDQPTRVQLTLAANRRYTSAPQRGSGEWPNGLDPLPSRFGPETFLGAGTPKSVCSTLPPSSWRPRPLPRS